ncbi:MAG TPA: SPOR domain-containing protein [Gemmatimonadaceae bacterium]|nr:SPOR domain-containing protein [Gemmatimonadaceae bacterium]
MSRMFWRGLMICVVPAIVSAQGTTGINPVYRKAQALVNDGNPTVGRALVDSMMAIAAPGSNEYAEAVYWRAVLAPTTAEAELDYRRIVVEYPLSPRVADALIRLAQLDITRANYDGAVRHLNRLALEHPQSPARGRAGYWLARALFEKNDIQGACAATSDALTRTSEDDAELRNQIIYLNQRCAGVIISGTSSPVTTTAATTASPLRDSTAARMSTSQPVAPTPAPATVPQSSPIVSSNTSPVADSVPPVVPEAAAKTPVASAPNAAAAKPATKPAAKPPMKIPAKPNDVDPTNVETVIPDPPASSRTDARSSRSSSGEFSVQIAAYNVRSQATAMADRMKKRGYEARVSGAGAPFRVRIGRYASQAEAAAVQRSLKAKQIEGFVVQAEAR